MTATSLSARPTNRAGNQRAHLWEILAGCLPDRVYAYAPAGAVPAQVAPAIWIAPPDGGTVRPSYVATWHVWAVADGAGHDAQAMLDELLSTVLTALAASDYADVAWAATSWTVGDVEWPALHFEVSATLAASTLCPPIPTAALIPPEVIQ